MINILHFADLHIGIDSHGFIDPESKINIRTLDILDGIDAMIDMAIEEDIDLALFAGDAFHKHSPAQSYVNEFGKRILRLRKQCPVVLLVGNHDMPGSDRASALEIYKTLEVEGVIVGKSCELYKVETKHGTIQVATVPYPNRTWLDAKESLKHPTDVVSRMLKDETTKRIRKLADSIDSEYPAVLLGHFTAEGSQFGSERELLVSKADAAVTLEDLTAEAWDYVALGHIHKHQDISHGIKNLPPIVYAGSIDRVDFGEEKDAKGFVKVSISDKRVVSWEFIDIGARPYKTLEFRVKGKDATDKIIDKIESKSDIEGAVVRIIITPVDDLTRLSISREEILNAVMRKKALFVKSFSVLLPEERSIEQTSLRAGALDPSMTPSQMVVAYFQNLGKSDAEIKDLLKLHSDIVVTCEVENG
jgi:exonuclease SbcD